MWINFLIFMIVIVYWPVNQIFIFMAVIGMTLWGHWGEILRSFASSVEITGSLKYLHEFEFSVPAWTLYSYRFGQCGLQNIRQEPTLECIFVSVIFLFLRLKSWEAALETNLETRLIVIVLAYFFVSFNVGQRTIASRQMIHRLTSSSVWMIVGIHLCFKAKQYFENVSRKLLA